ncbi:YidB family protein [Bradyrhizobium sp. WD16]|uniref:YidB family protein n=1 Tax=Bradyrhizobium sp. WD16 TaxID=1521768 RepID=UPI0020A34FE2|nr:YidB family protein [Bradyrhizobium sp. WD16]UTD27351.1 hypothetical protein DB459_10865 [Bradyrhizobium sp. WD16]
MGLLDVLNGMQNGPRGPRDEQRSGGMSPLTMAILALLAYKAYKKVSGQPQAAPAPSPAPAPSSTTASSGGGLGGILGGLLAGGAAGSVLSGGLGDLLQQIQDAGHSDKADSWVSPGPNKQISPNDLANALGADQISTMMAQSGLSRDELLEGLSQHLPEAINQLTPDGRLPTEQEASRMI